MMFEDNPPPLPPVASDSDSFTNTLADLDDSNRLTAVADGDRFVQNEGENALPVSDRERLSGLPGGSDTSLLTLKSTDTAENDDSGGGFKPETIESEDYRLSSAHSVIIFEEIGSPGIFLSSAGNIFDVIVDNSATEGKNSSCESKANVSSVEESCVDDDTTTFVADLEVPLEEADSNFDKNSESSQQVGPYTGSSGTVDDEFDEFGDFAESSVVTEFEVCLILITYFFVRLLEQQHLNVTRGSLVLIRVLEMSERLPK